jgi:hypothetical protein
MTSRISFRSLAERAIATRARSSSASCFSINLCSGFGAARIWVFDPTLLMLRDETLLRRIAPEHQEGDDVPLGVAW